MSIRQIFCLRFPNRQFECETNVFGWNMMGYDGIFSFSHMFLYFCDKEAKTFTADLRFTCLCQAVSYTVKTLSAVFTFAVLAFSTCYNATHYK